jgi:hypothetical protein
MPQNQATPKPVIPAKAEALHNSEAGQSSASAVYREALDPSFRWDDGAQVWNMG